MPAYRDNGPGTCGTDEQATVDRRADQEGFRRVMAALGVSAVSHRWSDLQKLCAAKRHYVYDRMPRLHGFDPEWDGMWCYAFDLMRSAIYPAQANFKDAWMVPNPHVRTQVGTQVVFLGCVRGGWGALAEIIEAGGAVCVGREGSF